MEIVLDPSRVVVLEGLDHAAMVTTFQRVLRFFTIIESLESLLAGWHRVPVDINFYQCMNFDVFHLFLLCR